MRLEIPALVLAVGWFVFLLIERRMLIAARKRFRAVVHVNGTRGKSETTRLIAAALRASGFRTMAKTTGTEPRLIMPDGSERRIRRRGAADVREQRWLLLLAARERIEILVAECMAVGPEAQYASDAFLAPSILAITNIRPDHSFELGDPEETLEVFGRFVPSRGFVATADPFVAEGLAARVAARDARLVLAPPLELERAGRPDNAGLALAVALECGARREEAMAGLKAHRPDPGAFAVRMLRVAGGDIHLLDAFAANDVVSTELLFAGAEARLPPLAPGAARILVIANRVDRPDRAMAFARWAAAGVSVAAEDGAPGAAAPGPAALVSSPVASQAPGSNTIPASGPEAPPDPPPPPAPPPDLAALRGRWDRVVIVGALPLGARFLLARAFLRRKGGAGRIVHLSPRRLPDFLAGLPAGSRVLCAGNWKRVGVLVRKGSYEF